MEERETFRKIVALRMTAAMGITLSFFLSLTGTVFRVLATSQYDGFLIRWLIGFMLSLLISLVIGFIVPMNKISDAIDRRFAWKHKIGAGLLKCLVSDLIYTPFITFFMVFFSYRMARSSGAKVAFLPMFLPSFFVCFVIGYVLILIFTPLYLKIFTRNIPMGPDQSE